ncbi:MAG: hypothetical protein U0586_10805 [Candidatus Brocadiaceae bacterium]
MFGRDRSCPQTTGVESLLPIGVTIILHVVSVIYSYVCLIVPTLKHGRRACERLLRNAGYNNVRVERYKINWLWGLMTAKAQANHD